MSSGICSVNLDYEPESYREMMDDLELLKNRLERVKKGFIPDEDTIGWYLNLPFMIDESCPFCYVKRQHETITIKSHDGHAIQELKEELEKEEKWLLRFHGMYSNRQRGWPKLGPHFIKYSHVEDSHYALIFTYNIAKGLVIKGIEQAIDDHKDYIDQMKEEYDDYPMFQERFKRFTGAWYSLEDAVEVRATADDCDKLIRWLESKAREIKEFRDEEFNTKLPIKPIAQDQAKLTVVNDENH